MPAMLARRIGRPGWGETGTPEEAKACLKTVKGVKWKMAKEERAASPKVMRGKPTVSNPGGLMRLVTIRRRGPPGREPYSQFPIQL